MKISQFKDKFLYSRQLVERCEFVAETTSLPRIQAVYNEFPRLNICVRSDINMSLFLDLTREYRHHPIFIKKIFAIFYIFTIFTLSKIKITNFLFSRYVVTLPDFYPAVIGGNNRLRIVDATNSNAILVSRSPKQNFAIFNTLKAYSDKHFANLGIMPEILPLTNFIYLERQINGLSINRLALAANQTKIIVKNLNLYFERQESLSESIGFEDFLDLKVKLIEDFLSIIKFDQNEIFLESFVGIVELIKNFSSINSIKIAPSHGDLNRGNILFCDGKVHIIDWEYYMYRYSEYDRVIFTNNLRHKSLKDYEHFIANSDNHDFNTVVFLLEELVFRIMNFKSDVPDSMSHVDLLCKMIRKQNFNE